MAYAINKIFHCQVYIQNILKNIEKINLGEKE